MSLNIYGIRHHGPGCARSLIQALDAERPDVVLIEGPPDADALLFHAADEGMQPPLALMLYAADDPKRCVFYPFADFSPEWQAIRWSVLEGVPVRFMDLPVTHQLAKEMEEEAAPPETEVEEEEEEPAIAEDQPVAEEIEVDPEAEAQLDNHDLRMDPLGWLGRAAGYGGGEEWWEHMVEQRQDGAELFVAIAEAMTAVRAEAPPHPSEAYNQREALREAHMRKTIRAAQKEFENVAVVCGAWHVPALATMPSAASDQALLKNLPKAKVEATWIPWTYDRLASESGYGAGVDSPAWYEHLWRRGAASNHVTTWFTSVARLLRNVDLDCSAAHVIECVRLSETLASVRERPLPGLAEMMEAAQTILTTGDDAPLRLIRRDLIIGHKLGQISESVPAVPLQRNLEKLQKSLRLKVTATSEELDLDLRKPNDLERSQLFYRLLLLNIPWAKSSYTRGGKGTFREGWRLQWNPEFALNVIEAAPYGNTVEEASAAIALEKAAQAKSLREVTELVSRLLLADLPGSLSFAMHELENRSAVTGDVGELMDALPPLANVSRYGDVRQTDSSQIAHVFSSLLTRICIGTAAGCQSLDDDAAAAMAGRISAVHTAVRLVDDPQHRKLWLPALVSLADAESVHNRVRGLASRLLLDEAFDEDTEGRMSRALSRGIAPEAASAWVEGFLTGSAMVLVHDAKLLNLLDDWVSHLNEEHFIQVLPLLRRSFSLFPPPERRMIGERIRGSASAAGAQSQGTPEGWDQGKLEKLLPSLRTILGIPS